MVELSREDWDHSNRGRRLDHIWVTPALESKVNSYNILREARGWKDPQIMCPCDRFNLSPSLDVQHKGHRLVCCNHYIFLTCFVSIFCQYKIVECFVYFIDTHT